jgi:hypothetical protein
MKGCTIFNTVANSVKFIVSLAQLSQNEKLNLNSFIYYNNGN